MSEVVLHFWESYFGLIAVCAVWRLCTVGVYAILQLRQHLFYNKILPENYSYIV